MDALFDEAINDSKTAYGDFTIIDVDLIRYYYNEIFSKSKTKALKFLDMLQYVSLNEEVKEFVEYKKLN